MENQIKMIFLHYDRKSLETKTSFREGEKGSFGNFTQGKSSFGHRNQPEEYIVFAQNQEDFDAPEEFITKTNVKNHRFHEFLFDELKLDPSSGHMKGGKDGEYEVKNNVLLIKPFYKGGFERDGSHLGKLVKDRGEFEIKEYKTLESLHCAVI